MSQYICVSGRAELPAGSIFSAHPRYPYSTGALLLFLIGGLYLIIGRWFPNLGGLGLIIQPGRYIRLTGKVEVEILGEIRTMQSENAYLN